ncbi:hypothetical protein [Streptomyces sp. NPDC102462]|uniref:hypothetical protein n=1 Tax=Streptomyces sp. NPDC102462 TaxID=3366178 RepID=UPI00381C9FDD
MSDISSPPPPGGNNPQRLTGALQSLAMQLQAFLHQKQTLNNLPSNAANALRQARQSVLDPNALFDIQPPLAPKAIILPEKGEGQTVEDILGKNKVDPLRDFSKEAKADDKSGETYAKWEKDHTTKDRKGREKLEITLSAEARRLLTVLDSTGVPGASATATPPLSPYAANPNYSE